MRETLKNRCCITKALKLLKCNIITTHFRASITHKPKITSTDAFRLILAHCIAQTESAFRAVTSLNYSRLLWSAAATLKRLNSRIDTQTACAVDINKTWRTTKRLLLILTGFLLPEPIWRAFGTTTNAISFLEAEILQKYTIPADSWKNVLSPPSFRAQGLLTIMPLWSINYGQFKQTNKDLCTFTAPPVK